MLLNAYAFIQMTSLSTSIIYLHSVVLSFKVTKLRHECSNMQSFDPSNQYIP